MLGEHSHYYSPISLYHTMFYVIALHYQKGKESLILLLYPSCVHVPPTTAAPVSCILHLRALTEMKWYRTIRIMVSEPRALVMVESCTSVIMVIAMAFWDGAWVRGAACKKGGFRVRRRLPIECATGKVWETWLGCDARKQHPKRGSNQMSTDGGMTSVVFRHVGYKFGFGS